MMKENESPVEGIFFSFVTSHGVRYRLASTAKDLLPPKPIQQQRRSVPLVLLLHGFPESWYAWRHQLLILGELYLAVAPDMKGYGGTDHPLDVEDYTQPKLALEVVGIAEALGYNEFYVVGHDWGAQLAWSVSLLYPERVLGVCGLSVPYAGAPKASLLDVLQQRYGKCLGFLRRKVVQEAQFHYMLPPLSSQLCPRVQSERH